MCSRCGSPVYRVKSSRAEIVCQPCRRTRSEPSGARSQGGRGQCERCGSPRKLNAKRFCSIECSAAWQSTTRGAAPRKGRECAQCGATYDAGNATQACCSVACRREYDAAHRLAKPKPVKPRLSRVHFPTCKGCGHVFAARSAAKRWCSDRCWLNEQANRVNSFYALACQIGSGGAMWRGRLVGYLVDRDGPRCAICRRKVDLSLKSGPRGDERGPSIDHIVPRSQGGGDDLANLRLAHWGCNRARKAKGGNEQLALVG